MASSTKWYVRYKVPGHSGDVELSAGPYPSYAKVFYHWADIKGYAGVTDSYIDWETDEGMERIALGDLVE